MKFLFLISWLSWFWILPAHDIAMAVFELNLKEKACTIRVSIDKAYLDAVLLKKMENKIDDSSIENYLKETTSWNFDGHQKDFTIEQIKS